MRQLRLHRLTQLRDVPSAIADRAFLNLLYGEHPYGHSPIGTELALASMTVDDVRAFHAQAMRPSVATLIAVGDCDHDTIRRLAHDAFGDWHGAAIDGNAVDPALPQAAAAQHRPAPRRTAVGAADRPCLRASKHAGLSRAGDGEHGARRAVQQPHQSEPARGQGVHLRRADRVRVPAPRRSVRAAGRRADERDGPVDHRIDRTRSRRWSARGRLPRKSCALAAAALTRGYARNFETADQIARAATQLALYDLPDTYFAEFVPRIEQLTTGEVTSAMARHLQASRLTTVIVGDYEVVGAELQQLGLGEPVVLPPDTF